MKIKATVRYHLTHDRMAINKRTRNSKSAGYEEKGNLYTVDGNVNCATTMENKMEFPQRIRTAIRSNSFTSGYLIQENSNTNSIRCSCSIIYNSQDVDAI